MNQVKDSSTTYITSGITIIAEVKFHLVGTSCSNFYFAIPPQHILSLAVAWELEWKYFTVFRHFFIIEENLVSVNGGFDGKTQGFNEIGYIFIL
jgi:hypothetical protein